MELNDLTPEQIEKAKACTDARELMELAKAENMELTDEQLEAIAGGTGATAGYDDEAVAIKKLVPKADPNRPIYTPDDRTMEEKLAELQEKLSQLGK